MIKGLKGFVEGKVVRGSALQAPDLSIRKMAAVAALSRHGQAGAQLLTTIDIEPDLWPRRPSLTGSMSCGARGA